MIELLKKILEIPIPFNMVIMVVLIGVTGSTIAVVAREIRKFFSLRDELEFKRDMVAQGMSAQDTERLLNASRQPSDPSESPAMGCGAFGAHRH